MAGKLLVVSLALGLKAFKATPLANRACSFSEDLSKGKSFAPFQRMVLVYDVLWSSVAAEFSALEQRKEAASKELPPGF